MIKYIRILLCLILSASSVLLCCSCTNQESSAIVESSTAKPTEEITTSGAATDDTAQIQSPTCDYVRLKQKSDEIMADYDKIISEESFNGALYFKIGNDFEYIKSSGSANSGKHINNSANVCYYIGEVTQQFTASAVFILAEQNKLSLDDTIDKYYPDYKNAEKITIRNLLTMTSGIKDYVTYFSEIEGVSKNNSAKENKKQIMNWIFSQELLFEPDAEFRYSNSNYYILGDIIEKAGKKSYEAFVEENILKPLGMKSTGFKSSDKLAVGYYGSDYNKFLFYPGAAYSSSGMISTLSDLLKWVDGFTQYKVVSEDSLKTMFTSYKENYAYGFYVYDGKASSSGKLGSYNSMLVFKADESDIYIALSNYSYCNPVVVYRLFNNELKSFYG